jgi:hypothetical protein
MVHSKALQNILKLGFLVENKPSGNPALKVTFKGHVPPGVPSPGARISTAWLAQDNSGWMRLNQLYLWSGLNIFSQLQTDRSLRVRNPGKKLKNVKFFVPEVVRTQEL